MADASPILAVHDLTKIFEMRGPFGRVTGRLAAVDGVSLDLAEGEVLGLVGESGCGKSTLGKTIMGIHDPTSGTVAFEGELVAGPGIARPRAVRARLQYAYQDPGASLDPRWKIGRSLHEPLIVHTDWNTAEREARVREIVRAVGLPDQHLDLYPHEISGGQQRRVGLARILMLRPRVVILDEPTSGLDVSVQATVLALFRDLQAIFNLTYMLVSHDLAVVRTMCRRVAVMYLGRIVEIGPTEEIFERPRHPYTKLLLGAVPRIGGPRVTRAFALKGEPADATRLPAGCRFQGRCPRADARCAAVDPMLDGAAHAAACHHPLAPADAA